MRVEQKEAPQDPADWSVSLAVNRRIRRAEGKNRYAKDSLDDHSCRDGRGRWHDASRGIDRRPGRCNSLSDRGHESGRKSCLLAVRMAGLGTISWLLLRASIRPPRVRGTAGVRRARIRSAASMLDRWSMASVLVRGLRLLNQATHVSGWRPDARRHPCAGTRPSSPRRRPRGTARRAQRQQARCRV